ncbi:hypothetical protein NBRC116596_07370 [Litorivita sp. NS0012-18]
MVPVRQRKEARAQIGPARDQTRRGPVRIKGEIEISGLGAMALHMAAQGLAPPLRQDGIGMEHQEPLAPRRRRAAPQLPAARGRAADPNRADGFGNPRAVIGTAAIRDDHFADHARLQPLHQGGKAGRQSGCGVENRYDNAKRRAHGSLPCCQS